MADDLERQDEALRCAALRLYADRGLEALLRRYGEPHLTGSVSLGLMTWPDLDLYIVTDDLALHRFFRLGADLADLLHPERMIFRDERPLHPRRDDGRPPGAQPSGDEDLPEGLYWGLRLPEESGSVWNIDVWALSPEEAAERLAVRDAIAARLTPETRLRILTIKDAVWRDPGYRVAFHSTDIYAAVLEHGVTDAEGLRRYLQERSLRARGAAG